MQALDCRLMVVRKELSHKATKQKADKKERACPGVNDITSMVCQLFLKITPNALIFKYSLQFHFLIK